MMNVENYIANASRKTWDTEGLANDIPLRPIQRVGIIGAGTMGGGIAMNFASAAIPAIVIETNEDALERGINTCRANYQRSADKGRFPKEEVNERMSRISGSLNIEDISDCDLIIEAVFEDIDLKKSIFNKLEKIAKPGAILATNTSGLNIDDIASVTNRASDIIGLHFFSPANVMKLMEIVQAKHTAYDVILTAMATAKKIGKIAALVGVCPGFVGNRILYTRQKQAQKLLTQGLMPWNIDAAFHDFGFRMGPFEMSDLAGLDIGWKKGMKTHNPIRDALCDLDRRGQKTRAGYYDYDKSRKPTPSDITAKIIRTMSNHDNRNVQMSTEEIIDFCIYPMINEGVRILEENKAQRPSDIDIIWLHGYGWPGDKGGLMYYGDMIGPDKVLKSMKKLSETDASLAPAKELVKVVQNNTRLIDIDTGGLKT